MTWGPKAGQSVSDGEFLSKLAKETGVVPHAIANRPMLNQLERPLWHAFHTLHAGRTSNGFGANPIPLQEIVCYAELLGHPAGDEQIEFVQIIRAMDSAYLNFVRKKNV